MLEQSIIERLERLERQNRRLKQFFTAFVIAVCAAGFSQAATSQSQSAKPRSALADLALTPADISKLDWVFLNAKLDAFITYGESNPSPQYGYIPETNQIAVFSIASKSWFDATSLKELKSLMENWCSTVYFSGYPSTLKPTVQSPILPSSFGLDTDVGKAQTQQVYRQCTVTIRGLDGRRAVLENGELTVTQK